MAESNQSFEIVCARECQVESATIPAGFVVAVEIAGKITMAEIPGIASGRISARLVDGRFVKRSSNKPRLGEWPVKRGQIVSL